MRTIAPPAETVGDDQAQGRRLEGNGAAVTSLILGSYLAMGLALTAGLWRHPAGLRIAGNPGDTDLYQWWLGWWVHALHTAENPFFTDAMNLPIGVSLMANTSMPLPAVLTAWLTASAGPLVTYNVLIGLAPVATASAMMLCLRRLDLSRPAAAIGGAVFGFAPAIMNSMLGHLPMALAFLLPVLVWLATEAWRTTRPRRHGLLLGLVAFAQLMIGEEILFQAGVATLVVLAVLAAARPGRLAEAAPRALRTYAWAMASFTPLAAYPLYAQFFGRLRAHGSPFVVDYFAADLTSFFTPSELVWNGNAAQMAALPGGAPEHLAFLGIPLLTTCVAMILAEFSDLRVRAAGLGFVVFAVLSLGGTLWVGGEQTSLTMPYRLLTAVPVVEAALPSRLGVVTAMFAAVLLSLAIDALLADAGPRLGKAFAAGLAVLVTVTLLPKPLPVETVPEIPRYFPTAARELPAGTRALVVPIATPHHTEPLRWQQAADYSYATPHGYFIAPGPDRRSLIGVNPGPVEQLFVTVQDEGWHPSSPRS